MAERSSEHITGDRAQSAVLNLWLHASDAAAAHNFKDYGEDIFIQPCLNGLVDNTVIYVQVKGTDKPPKVDAHGRLVPRPVTATYGQIARWLQMGTLSVLVRWDVPNEIGWYKVIHSEFSEEMLWGKSPKKRKVIRFNPDHQLNKDAIRIMEWRARLNSAAGRIAWLMTEQQAAELLGNEPISKSNYSAAMQVVNDIMVKLDMVEERPDLEGVGHTEHFKQSMLKLTALLLENEEHPDAPLWPFLAYATPIFHLQNLFDRELGLPGSLVLAMGEYCTKLLACYRDILDGHNRA